MTAKLGRQRQTNRRPDADGVKSDDTEGSRVEGETSSKDTHSSRQQCQMPISRFLPGGAEQFHGRVAPRACGGDAFVYNLTQIG